MESQKKQCRMRTTTGYCPRPLEKATAYISKKWTISIVTTIGNYNIIRFSDLQERIGITPKMLSQRLKELQKEKILKKKAYKETPLRTEYQLTRRGQELMKSLIPLITWAEKSNQ